jgi:hypothetical protein
MICFQLTQGGLVVKCTRVKGPDQKAALQVRRRKRKNLMPGARQPRV